MKKSKSSPDIKKPIEGFLIIDKPTGISSYDVIRVIKKRLSPRKIGHTGTLDPLASGVLPVVMNGATKAIPFLDEGVKRYEGTLRLGTVTDSDDSTGNVLKEIPLDRSVMTKDRICRTLEQFLGKMKQAPPMFSAAKHRGTPLYKLARRGIKVERKEREVEILSLEMTGVDLPLVDFKVSCTRGTYVRALARQIGDVLGVGAHLCRLRRMSSGPFSLEQAVTLAEFDRLVDVDEIERRIITVREALGSMPEIEVGSNLGNRIRTGGQVFLRDLEGLKMPCLERNQRVKILHQGEILAIAKAQASSSDPRGQTLALSALSLIRVFA